MPLTSARLCTIRCIPLHAPNSRCASCNGTRYWHTVGVVLTRCIDTQPAADVMWPHRCRPSSSPQTLLMWFSSLTPFPHCLAASLIGCGNTWLVPLWVYHQLHRPIPPSQVTIGTGSSRPPRLPMPPRPSRPRCLPFLRTQQPLLCPSPAPPPIPPPPLPLTHIRVLGYRGIQVLAMRGLQRFQGKGLGFTLPCQSTPVLLASHL